MASLRAFREEFVSSETLDVEEFNAFDARKVRYELLWAMYENTAYREVHNWAKTYKTRYGLYRYIRNIYCPAYRLGEFHKAHVWGGSLDPMAGDGEVTPSALPIVTQNERLRQAISNVWQWSNWPVRKDIVTLHGAIMGDAIIRAVDNVARGKVYLELIHPGIVKELVKDDFGNVKGYTLEEIRAHPETGRDVTYTETAERGNGLDVVYRTYLNGALYAWNGVAAEWVEPYGFVPLIHIQHNDVGLDWGWSELHPARSKMHEVDDVASILSDQIRKTINVKWLFAGVQKPSSSPSPGGASETTSAPEPGREEESAFYVGNADVKAVPLVAQLDIEGSVHHILEILKDLERDYPELKFDAMRASGEISGRALRVARQPAETKVYQRRANYDDALVRAHQMAVSIGGLRAYPGFQGFNLDSYDAGDLQHHIGSRSVFYSDPLDDLDEDLAFWQTAKAAKEAGLPLEIYLQRAGWSQEDLDALANSPEAQARVALLENLNA